MSDEIEITKPSTSSQVKKEGLYPRTCKHCSNTFSNRHKFWNHRIRCQGAFIICEQCSHVYKSRLAFYDHCCSNTKKDPKKRQTKCLFENCTSVFFRRHEMLTHMEAVHSTEIKETSLNFENTAEFEQWKEEESARCFTYFRKQRGTKTIKQDVQYDSYICQFDAPNRKKNSKIPDYCCTARMQVKTSLSGVSVRYISSHTHSLNKSNSKFHPYPKVVVNYIKELLLKGVTPRTIYNLIQSNTDPIFQLKDQPVTVKYINNIKYHLKVKGELDNQTLIKTRHKEGLNIDPANVIELSETIWHIHSENLSHTVEKVLSVCDVSDVCLHRCPYAVCVGLCSHLYNCSCDEVKPCKHIHRVQSLQKKRNRRKPGPKTINYDDYNDEELFGIPMDTYQDPKKEIIIENVDNKDIIIEDVDVPIITDEYFINAAEEQAIPYKEEDSTDLDQSQLAEQQVLSLVTERYPKDLQLVFKKELDNN